MRKRITKVTTKTGDDGTSAMADGSRVSKADPIINSIGEIDEFGWNFLVDVQELPGSKEKIDQLSLVHWTLGGPWFKNGQELSTLDKEWFLAREQAMNF